MDEDDKLGERERLALVSVGIEFALLSDSNEEVKWNNVLTMKAAMKRRVTFI